MRKHSVSPVSHAHTAHPRRSVHVFLCASTRFGAHSSGGICSGLINYLEMCVWLCCIQIRLRDDFRPKTSSFEHLLINRKGESIGTSPGWQLAGNRIDTMCMREESADKDGGGEIHGRKRGGEDTVYYRKWNLCGISNIVSDKCWLACNWRGVKVSRPRAHSHRGTQCQSDFVSFARSFARATT